MRYFNYLFLALSLATFDSCINGDPNKQIDEGEVSADIYVSDELGWSMQIPTGWTIISKRTMDNHQEKGVKKFEKTSGVQIDDSGVIHHLAFQHSRGNVFQATSEPFEVEYEGEFEESVNAIYSMIYDSYMSEGIKVDTFSSRSIISNKEFSLFKITMYNPSGDIILHQDMYTRLINGNIFTATITYTNEEDKKTLNEIWSNSEFKE